MVVGTGQASGKGVYIFDKDSSTPLGSYEISNGEWIFIVAFPSLKMENILPQHIKGIQILLFFGRDRIVHHFGKV